MYCPDFAIYGYRYADQKVKEAEIAS